MNFCEPLPENCPPDVAVEIISDVQVFRLVRSLPPTLDAFRSQRAERPQALFKGVTECEARGVSVFTERRDAEEKALKLPKFRHFHICCLTLAKGAGWIAQTFQPSHHTWWPLAEFDVLSNCKLEAA